MVPIKDINSILIKKCVHKPILKECNFINDGYNKNG